MYKLLKRCLQVILFLYVLFIVYQLKEFQEERTSADKFPFAWHRQKELFLKQAKLASQRKSSTIKSSAPKPRVSTEKIKQRFQTRQSILQDACKRVGNRPRAFKRIPVNQFSLGPAAPYLNFTFTICPIQKIGFKTWWDILHNIKTNNSKLKKNNYSVPQQVTILTDVRAVFVREPYSRLLSAYVDKLFVPNPLFDKIGTYIVGKFRANASDDSLFFGHDVTFAEFVKYVIDAETTGKYRNVHFVPVHNHCDFCKVEYNYIGHMETFSEDIKVILEAAQSPWSYQPQYSYDKFTMREDLDYMLKKYTVIGMSIHEALKRLWKSWQIRGILSKKIAFPLSPEDTANITVEAMARTAWHALDKSGPKALRTLQRTEAMREAYATVPLKDRMKLRELFALDFELFGYDDRTPVDIFASSPRTYHSDNKTADKNFSYFRP